MDPHEFWRFCIVDDLNVPLNLITMEQAHV
jgi:hypothetical protein